MQSFKFSCDPAETLQTVNSFRFSIVYFLPRFCGSIEHWVVILNVQILLGIVLCKLSLDIQLIMSYSFEIIFL
jgi:hypothetical protein